MGKVSIMRNIKPTRIYIDKDGNQTKAPEDKFGMAKSTAEDKARKGVADKKKS